MVRERPRAAKRHRLAAIAASVAVVVAACGENSGRSQVDGIVVPDGFGVATAVDGLAGPTQIAADGAGGFVLAELNGGERDGTGRVVRYRKLEPESAEVLVTDLVTPTGVTVDTEGRLWIMEQRRLTVGPLDDPADRTIVLDQMPFNGRSEGTLTAIANGEILYDTAGSRDADRPAELKPGHGTLWRLASPDAEPVEVATGLKHAYAHVIDADGQLWSTEMSDGRLDDTVPPDELVLVSDGDDFGYPICIGDGTPVRELGATTDDCAATPPSHALFDPSATPTSVAIAPWDPQTLLVALWSRGEIVAVPRDPADAPHPPEVVVSGDLTPQHLLADGDTLLVTDFTGGRVLAITRP